MLSVNGAEADALLNYDQKAEVLEKQADLLVIDMLALGGSACEPQPSPLDPSQNTCDDEARYLHEKQQAQSLYNQANNLKEVGNQLGDIFDTERAALGTYESNPTDTTYANSRADLESLVNRMEILSDPDVKDSDKSMLIVKAQETLTNLDAIKTALRR